MRIDLLTVEYPPGLPEADVDEIVAMLDRAEQDAEVRPAEVRKGSVSMEPWQVVVIVSATSYLNAFAEAAAKETWEATRKAIAWIAQRIAHRRPAERSPGDGDLILVMQDRHLSFALTASSCADLEPFHAISDLLHAGPEPGTSYRWDAREHRWEQLRPSSRDS